MRAISACQEDSFKCSSSVYLLLAPAARAVCSVSSASRVLRVSTMRSQRADARALRGNNMVAQYTYLVILRATLGPIFRDRFFGPASFRVTGFFRPPGATIYSYIATKVLSDDPSACCLLLRASLCTYIYNAGGGFFIRLLIDIFTCGHHICILKTLMHINIFK